MKINKSLFSVKIVRVIIGILIIVLALNLGKAAGIILFKLCLWLGLIPYFEWLFGWIVF